MDEPIVVAEGLHKRFGDKHALRGLDLAVPAGTVCGVLGPNGAGKTTAVRILATLTDPDAGYARIDGYDVVSDADRVRGIIGLAGQHAAVDEKLTGRENLRMFGRLYHLPRAVSRTRADELLERFGLMDAADRAVSTFSGGMRRRLDLIASLIIAPRVLFLDEPTTGLDPRSRGEIWEAIRALVQDGTTVLLTTQYLDEADQLADDIAVVDHGRVIGKGAPDQLKATIGTRLDVVLEDPARVADASVVLARMTRTEPAVGDGPEDGNRISLPVEGEAVRLADVVRELDLAGIAAADVALRRPTLDEVFLKLTDDQPSGEPAAPQAAPRAARQTGQQTSEQTSQQSVPDKREKREKSEAAR